MYSHAHLTWGSNSNLISQSWQGLFSFISKSHVHYDLWFINDFPKSSKLDKFSMWWSIINLFWLASNLQKQNIQLGLKHETAIFSILNLNSASRLKFRPYVCPYVCWPALSIKRSWDKKCRQPARLGFVSCLVSRSYNSPSNPTLIKEAIMGSSISIVYYSYTVYL